MREQKVVGLERFALEEIAEITSGNSIPAKDRNGKFSAANAEGRYFISTKDVGFDGNISTETDVRIPSAYQNQFKLAKSGSTLVCSEGGSAGRKVGFLAEDAHYGNKLFAVLGGNRVIPKYLFYFCKTKDFLDQFEDRKTGLIGGVSLKKFKSIEVPLPPLEVQAIIVENLERALNGLERAHELTVKNLADVHELAAAQFDLAVTGAFCGPETADETVDKLLDHIKEIRAATKGAKNFPMLDGFESPQPLRTGWKWVSLGSLTSRISDGVHKTPKYIEKGVPFVTVKNLTAGPGISFADTKFISENDHQELIKRTNPERGDILVSKDGTIGIVRQIKTDQAFSIFVSVALVKPIDYGLSDYLTIALQAPLVQGQIVPKGAALKHLYLGDLRKLPVPIGPKCDIEETVIRAKEITEILERLQAQFSQSLKDMENLRQSILQRAFAGELT